MPYRNWKIRGLFTAITALVLFAGSASAQSPFARYEDPIPSNVERMYVKGLKYLATSQQADGTWSGNYGNNAGVVGLAVLAFLAHGEDPTAGPYSTAIQRGVSKILQMQDSSTGYIGSSMYNHGFATLALAEAYGVVDNPKIGKALDKAVKLLISSQANNPHGAWRYGSSSTSADTTVSGACMVALLAARNAGLDIPETSIKKALNYYRTCQSADGGFGYTSSGSGRVTSTIGALCFALARKRKTTAFKDAYGYLKANLNVSDRGGHGGYYSYYYLYYAAQAYFHADPTNKTKLWQTWNHRNIQSLGSAQQSNGSWTGGHGPVFSTSAALLSLALNYRFLPIYER
jgi:hypothetical protein